MLWTANTERFAQLTEGINDTADNLLAAIEADEPEIAPSTLYAVACVLEGVPFVNGSPQNTFVPGLLELAVARGVVIGGDDFKSGQTKMKSVLVDFLVGAGIKPTSIVSYNHLGNNDGMNLSAPQTFRSKEISKSNVVDDMVASNALLYGPGEHPDHVVVIKYVPYVGDSKRAMDEYTSEIFLGGRNTIVMHNTCEDSLLAAPIILDLLLLTELLTRVQLRRDGEAALHDLHPVAALLSYLTKAPLVPQVRARARARWWCLLALCFAAIAQPLPKPAKQRRAACARAALAPGAQQRLTHPPPHPPTPQGVPVINALSKQRAMLENFCRACIGLPPDSNMMLEFK